MAKIQFGLKSADAIQQNFKIIFDRLVRGYKSMMGKNPEGLDLIKIRFEAAEKARDSAKVVDRGGMTLDPSKPIMGGTQEGAALKSGIMKATGEGPREITEDTGEGFIDFVRRTDPEGAAKLQKEEDRIRAMIEAANKRAAKNLKDKKKKLDDPEEKAMGGRIGFKKGMDRRTFMKIMGGLASIPVLGKFFKGAEVAAPVVEKAVDVASGAPPYFFNLVNRIRALGKRFDGPKERSEFFRYKDYEMDIDLDTGKIDIKKTKEAMIPGGDEAGVAEEVYMTYKPGMADETTKGRKVIDEYEEFTARPDIDGKMKDVEEGVPDEVVREGSIGKEQLEEEIVEQITRDKKASGGLAYMLGE